MTILIIIACLCFVAAPILWGLGFLWGFVWNKVLKPLMVSETEC